MLKLFFVLLLNRIDVFFEADNLPHQLAMTISHANSSLDIAFHQIYQDEVVDSLISAHSRGVRIRVITEHDYYDRTYELRAQGIPVVDEFNDPDAREHRMHNKFIVIDYWDSDTSNDAVWNGSYNASSAIHADNAVLIRSHALASIFEAEFNQMWGDTGVTPNPENARTGPNKSDVAPFHIVNVDGIEIEVYFSPQDNPAEKISYVVSDATSSIDFCMFYFTRDDIASTMSDRLDSGVEIRGVFDSSGMGYSRRTFDMLSDHGASVVIDQLPSPYHFLHHKFMVVDESVVETGSMNWTISGNRYNDENIMIIHDSATASAFEQEFLQRFHEAGAIGEDDRISSGQNNLSANKVIFHSEITFNEANVDIYNLSGQKVAHVNSFTYQGANLPAGVYFAVGKHGRLKIVKR